MSLYLAIVGILSVVAFELILITEQATHLPFESIQSRQAIFDRVDPRTGVSDCINKAAFCTHPLYRQVMWEQCPLTCHRLATQNPNGVVNPTVPVHALKPVPVQPLVSVGNVNPAHPTPMNLQTVSPDCSDYVNPKTGVSDCISRKALCDDKIYRQLMWEQCPRTCGKCPDNLPDSHVRPGNPNPVNPTPALKRLPVSVPVPIVQQPVANPNPMPVVNSVPAISIPPNRPAPTIVQQPVINPNPMPVVSSIPAISTSPVRPALAIVQQPVVNPKPMPVVSSVPAISTPSVRPAPANLLSVISVPLSSKSTIPASQALVAVRPPPPVKSNCCDYVNPKTGGSDCARTVHLCRHPNYIQVMREQCQKTCGFCV